MKLWVSTFNEDKKKTQVKINNNNNKMVSLLWETGAIAFTRK